MTQTKISKETIEKNISEKESRLIEDLSEKVSGRISDFVEYNLEDKMQTFSTSVDEAAKQAEQVQSTLVKIKDSVDSLGGIEFSDKVKSIYRAVEELSEATTKSKDDLSQINEQNKAIISDLTNASVSWNDLASSFKQSVANVESENDRLNSNSKAVMDSLTVLDGNLKLTEQKIKQFDDVCKKLKSISEAIIQINLNKTIDDFAQKIEQAEAVTSNSRSIFENVLRESQKYFEQLSSIINEWNDLKVNLSNSINENLAVNEKVLVNNNSLCKQIEEMNALESSMKDVLLEVKSRIEELNANSVISSINDLKANEEAAFHRVDSLEHTLMQKLSKPSITSICSIIIGACVLILQIISLFIK